MSKRELLFRLTKDDFEVETFRSSGSGGQRRDKKETAVRIKHPDSGAVAQSQDHRSQKKNKAEAFRRLVNTPKFKQWHKMKVGRIVRNEPPLEEQVEEAMQPENLKVECFNSEKGCWEEIKQ